MNVDSALRPDGSNCRLEEHTEQLGTVSLENHFGFIEPSITKWRREYSVELARRFYSWFVYQNSAIGPELLVNDPGPVPEDIVFVCGISYSALEAS
jgi:hypothetical protein